MRPFRVLWIDDGVYTAFKRSASDALPTSTQKPIGVLGKLRQHIAACAGEVRPAEVFLAGDLAMIAGDGVLPVHPQSAEWRHEYRTALDVLILDVGGLGRPLQADIVTTAVLAAATHAECEQLNTDYSGAAFYLANRRKLRCCQAVIIMTKFDQDGDPQPSQSELSLVEKFLDPCCRPDPKADGPHTVKYPATPWAWGKVTDIVTALYDDYCDGYTRLTHRDAIEFAATHDEPVLIVGETGTGKEYIAKAIHRRWRQEQARQGRMVPDRLIVVNCGGLDAELARSELFGHVRGSFTGADDHRLGAILQACGANQLATLKEGTAVPKDVRDDAKACIADIESILSTAAEEQGAPDKVVESMRSRLIPPLKKLFVGNSTSGVPIVELFRRIERALSAAGRRRNLIDEYEEAFRSANADMLDADTTVLRFKAGGRDARPGGTLFLDEFGDLPLSVQTMLLRYMETGEIQPVGYAGVIEGARTRLIVATSDPRIAEFAGVALPGSWRSDEELKRGRRDDLLHRVKGQIIQAEPVTPANVRAVLKHLLEHRPSEDPVPWQDEAIDRLGDQIATLLTRREETAKHHRRGAKHDPRFAFGHMRELSRTIKLADAYVRQAVERGLRGVGNEVTPDIVERVWRPSQVGEFMHDHSEEGVANQTSDCNVAAQLWALYTDGKKLFGESPDAGGSVIWKLAPNGTQETLKTYGTKKTKQSSPLTEWIKTFPNRNVPQAILARGWMEADATGRIGKVEEFLCELGEFIGNDARSERTRLCAGVGNKSVCLKPQEIKNGKLDELIREVFPDTPSDNGVVLYQRIAEKAQLAKAARQTLPAQGRAFDLVCGL